MDLTNLDLETLRTDPEGTLSAVCDGLIPSIINTLGVDVSAHNGDYVKILGQIMGIFGKSKTLRDNIPEAKRVLGADVYSLSRSWLAQSGIWDQESDVWRPVVRAYWSANTPVPSHVKSLILPPGVARRMARDADRPFDERHPVAASFEHIVMPRGVRTMKLETDGSDVEWYMAGFRGTPPTEYTLSKRLYGPRIEDNGRKPTVIRANTTSGSDVYKQAFGSMHHRSLINGPVLFVSDPLSALFAAGQFLNVVQPMGFDVDNLYVFGWDNRPVATCDEDDDPETSHNPVSAMNMVVRVLYEAAKTPRLVL